jgi:hypothetical protein
VAGKPDKKSGESVPRRPADPHAFDHVSPEERFLLFVAPQMGASKAAKCFRIDGSAVQAEWEKFSKDPLPINLKS